MTQIDSAAGTGPGSEDRPDAGRMLAMERIERLKDGAILYDASVADHARPEWFDPASWPLAPVAPGYSGGRGATLFISVSDQDWVLRHYHRGGRMARIASDGFLWLGEDRARSFAEWRLLAKIHAAGLIIKDLKELMDVLKEQAFRHKDTPCMGRSHGVHAEPMTFGRKFALWYEDAKAAGARNLTVSSALTEGIPSRAASLTMASSISVAMIPP